MWDCIYIQIQMYYISRSNWGTRDAWSSVPLLLSDNYLFCIVGIRRRLWHARLGLLVMSYCLHVAGNSHIKLWLLRNYQQNIVEIRYCT